MVVGLLQYNKKNSRRSVDTVAWVFKTGIWARCSERQEPLTEERRNCASTKEGAENDAGYK